MHSFIGTRYLSGEIKWDFKYSSPWDKEIGIKIAFPDHSSNAQIQRREAIKSTEVAVRSNAISWISPGNKEWIFDLEVLRAELSKFEDIPWLTGKVRLVPDFETQERTGFSHPSYMASVVFYITPEEISNMTDLLIQAPEEIHESLLRFIKDYPDPKKTAFIMMKFGATDAHENIIIGIRNCLKSFGITALRADDKQYHDDLFPNVLTYLWGCSFGISVFERIEVDDFNPNVSLEVGYMLAMKKPVCLLKDKTLKTLQTDLIGKHYRVFDPQNPTSSIPPVLTQWLKDKGIA